MKRNLTLTFEHDDSMWLDDEGVEKKADVLPEIMDVVNAAVEAVDLGFVEFKEARLDEALVVNRGGDAVEAVKALPQYEAFMRLLEDC